MPDDIPHPLTEGKFIFDGIQEGNGDTRMTITFKPPLVVNYTIWEKLDKNTGRPCYPEDVPFMGYATYDFGMEMNTPLDADHNWLAKGYGGLYPKSSKEDILMYSLIYDLFHAFCHCESDPNFSHYHWALKGWLKERATVKDYSDVEA